MPRGGARQGAGRKRGGRNYSPSAVRRESIERERLEQMPALTPEEAVRAAQGSAGAEVQQALVTPRRKLAKERCADLLEIAIGCTAFYQPVSIGGTAADTPENWYQFKDWLKIASVIGDKLIDTQESRFRSVTMAMMMPAPAQPTANDLAPALDNVHHINDPNASARVYLQLVRSKKAG
jgi:hypothetical protein